MSRVPSVRGSVSGRTPVRVLRVGACMFATIGMLLIGPFSSGLIRFACADDADTSKRAFFESKIRPVLVKHCYECHSHAAGVSESGLFLDTRKAIRKGGDRGPAVLPGKPKKSLLLTAISHSDPDLRMPPRVEKLPADVVADFERWIASGAFDPRNKVKEKEATATESWALQPIVPNEPPAVESDWPITKIDQFVLSKLEKNDLRPSNDAPLNTLLRRLHFDLIGLPPTPKDMETFASRVNADGLESALGTRVDYLLGLPEFGERWGRHWLDVARFAESSGGEANISFPYAWRYRDYVFDAFNDDVPYDRFLTEQIAGDLLSAEDETERTRLLIATGFLALGPKNLDAANQKQFDADLVDEQIDAVSRVFMASSLACARCHDHKFDPFTMRDYYALAGVFSSTRTFFGTAVSPSNRIGGDPLVLPQLAATPILHKSIPAKRIAKLKADQAALLKEKEEKGATLTLRDALRIFWRTGGIEGQLEKYDADGNALALAMGVLDSDEIGDAQLLKRGEVNQPAGPVARAFPATIKTAKPPQFSGQQSGRLEVARWLTASDHPLTSRVAVNRVWSHLFGLGLVSSVDDFGNTGESPSHPELLDYLADRFMREGWSHKRLIRQIVRSRTYRQASQFRSNAFRADPENRLLWRMSKRRIEAEAMRDAMLSVSGELLRERPLGSLVGSVIGDRPISLIGLDKRLPRDLDGSLHRSVYLSVLRDRLPDVLDVFDFAEPSLVTGRREATNVPTQALYLLNSDFVWRRAEAMAKRLQAETSNTREFIELAIRSTLGRDPTADERTRLQRFLARDEDKEQDADLRFRRAVSCCQALLSTVEFRVLD